MFNTITIGIVSIFMGHNLLSVENSFLGISQMNNKKNIFLVQDTLGNSITLECEEIVGKTERLSEKIRSLADVLVPAYTQTEVDFARKKPQDVAADFMLKSLAPLLEPNANKVDWQLFEQKTTLVLEQFFATMDWSKHTGSQDISIFVVAIEQKSGKQLGAIQFLITPEFVENNVKAALYGVIPALEDRGLEKILMSSIFKLRPHVERIFLHTRSTNQQAIAQYKDWGFTEFVGNSSNWTDLEYISVRSNCLQKFSESFIQEH